LHSKNRKKFIVNILIILLIVISPTIILHRQNVALALQSPILSLSVNS
jgi:hypothetical protein